MSNPATATLSRLRAPPRNAADDYVNLVRRATLAASSHNTQPWKFRLLPGSIVVLPDLSRRLPVVDPDDHHQYARLGCADEILLQAVSAAGLKSHFSRNRGAARRTRLTSCWWPRP